MTAKTIYERKQLLLQELKDSKTVFLDKTIEEVDSLLFFTQNSMRLTKLGLLMMSQVFKPYSYPHKSLKSKHLISLGNLMEFPYYLSTTTLTIFSEADAITISLTGLDKFLEVRFNILK